MTNRTPASTTPSKAAQPEAATFWRASVQKLMTVAEGQGVRAWLVVFLPVFCVFALTALFNLERVNRDDPMGAALAAESLAHDFDLTVEEAFGNKWITDAEGRPLSDRQPGVIFFGVPFYLLAPDNGFSMVPAAFAGAFAAAAAVATLLLLYKQLVSTRAAMAAAVIAAFATPTWTISGQSLWPHGPDQLFLALAMLMAARRTWVLSGIALGAAVVTRTHLAIVALVIGLWLTWRERSVRPVIVIGVPSVLGLLGVLVYTHHAFGVWDLSGGYSTRGSYPVARLLGDAHSVPFAFNVVGLLFSLQRGVLIISPFLWLLLPGLPRALRTAPHWAKASAAGGLLYMVAQLLINEFAGGGEFWGYRLALESLTLLSPLLVLCYREWTAKSVLRRRIFAALVILSVGYQAVGAFLFTNPETDFEQPFIDNYLFFGTGSEAPMITGGPYRAAVWIFMAITLLAALAVLAGKRPSNDDRGST